jgi:hypothetical protein
LKQEKINLVASNVANAKQKAIQQIQQEEKSHQDRIYMEQQIGSKLDAWEYRNM